MKDTITLKEGEGDFVDEEDDEEEDYDEEEDSFIVDEFDEEDGEGETISTASIVPPTVEVDEIADETTGEQAEEANPLSAEEEARGAEDAARAKGLKSTDDAQTLIGVNRPEVKTLQAYETIINTDEETLKVYSTIDEEINETQRMLQDGILALGNSIGARSSSDALPRVRFVLQRFVGVVTEAAEAISNCRRAVSISPEDLIEALRVLGRTVYWKGVTNELEENKENLADEEEEEDDEEFQPINEDEEEEDDEEGSSEYESSEEDSNEKINSTNEEEPDENHIIDTKAFTRLVENSVPESTVSIEGYDLVQSAAEDFLSSLLQSAASASKFRNPNTTEISVHDINFTLGMWGSSGGIENELLNRMAITTKFL